MYVDIDMKILMTINLIGYVIMLLLLSYYIITTLQWYSYKLERVIFHHTKSWWNIVYFFIPLFSYDFISGITDKRYNFVVTLIYLPLFIFWFKGLDKRLVFTDRVKRFFGIVLFVGSFLLITFDWYSLFIPILLAHLISNLIEKMLFDSFKREAYRKINSMKNLIVVGVTASYGKTSIKNYITTILSSKYRVYATPRSVNTLGGVIKDINENLSKNVQIYVVEMGARARGDILEITTFVEPHYSIVGKIGFAHIEYFKSLENIRNTKMEIIQTPRLRKAWVHKSANIKPTDKIELFGDEIKNVVATLEKTCFEIDGERYCAEVLGKFNAMNLSVSILLAKELRVDKKSIKRTLSRIRSAPHRLQRIDAGGKVILDDSYNGNIDGVLASFELCTLWSGRRVLITAGLVEVDRDLNERVAKRADEVFDLVVVTSSLNSQIFKENIQSDKFVQLLDKSKLQTFLQENTYPNDLILFSNDAPSFV